MRDGTFNKWSLPLDKEKKNRFRGRRDGIEGRFRKGESYRWIPSSDKGTHLLRERRA